MKRKHFIFLEAIGLLIVFVFIIPFFSVQAISSLFTEEQLTSDIKLLLIQICIDVSFLLAIATAFYLWKQKVSFSNYLIDHRNLMLVLIIAICSFILYYLFDPLEFYQIISTKRLNFFTFEFPKLETFSSTYIFIKTMTRKPQNRRLQS